MLAKDLVSIPATWMRGGTGKGLFFLDEDLPADRAAREAAILAALGSPDPYSRQLDGVGGATSSTSKAVIISPSARADCDVDYLFAHVGVDTGVIDYSGNCGNLSAAVGLFALEQGLVPQAQKGAVRVWQANLSQRFIARVPLMMQRSVRRRPS
ncbi:MAG: PrpF domain-containing protein [Pseudomonadota bacterium]